MKAELDPFSNEKASKKKRNDDSSCNLSSDADEEQMSIPDEDNYQINEKKPFQLQSGMDSDESVNQPQESSSDSDEKKLILKILI